ncbi:chitin synthase [Mycotypha africana]|uniref:chitin synthase n=1 Tax=Mycotypha africana TaxID=64632 RepID=UPI002300D2A7|nr:chitin synthase [Mycotypha africana]KAI8988510.1 chitin synthase [Mycotypha africana]
MTISASIKDSINTDDLTNVEGVSEELIANILRDRFLKNQIYTRIRHSTLVMINPYKDSRSEIQETSEEYLLEYKDTKSKKEDELLPAHIFQHVNQAYFHMRRTGSDQSIILSGLCGSGKSEMHQWILYHLVTLSNSKKPSKIQQMVQKAYGIVEAFGHAKTTVNENASGFGKHYEVQFNERGRMIGAKFLNYLLEKSRIAHLSGDERNYHVFYYVLHGATAEEKALLHLSDSIVYPYLFTSKDAMRLAAGLALEHKEKYYELKLLLKSLGMSRKTIFQIAQIIAAIIHLGSIQFVDDASSTQDSATVKDTNELEIAAELLGVEVKALEICLTYQTKLIKRDLTTIFLNAEQASAQRDALAETLYCLLFTWITENINKKLCKSECQNYISIVDFPGTLPAVQNASYDQFAFIYANERIHNFMLHSLFERNTEVYISLEIPIPSQPTVVYNDNCVQLLDASENSLVNVLSHEDPIPVVQRHTHWVETLEKLHNGSSHFGSKSSPNGKETLFAIEHFTGTITYSATEFFNRRIDTLSTDFTSLFAPTHSTTELPSNSLVTKIFKQKSTKVNPPSLNNITTATAKDTTVINQQLSSSIVTSVSEQQKGTTTTDANIASSLIPVVLDEQQQQKNQQQECLYFTGIKDMSKHVNDIVLRLHSTKPWFVVCLRSNDLLLPNSCDAKKLIAQIKTFDILSIIKRAKYEYTIDLDILEFCDRYENVINATSVDLDADPKAKLSALKDTYGWDKSMMTLSEEKVYLTELSWNCLENQLRAIEKREQRRARCIAKGIPFEEDTEAMSQMFLHLSGSGSMMEAASICSEDYDNGYDVEDLNSICSHQCDSTVHSLSTSDNKQRQRQQQPTHLLLNDENTVHVKGTQKHQTQQTLAEKTSRSRKLWVILTWLTTWWIPSFIMHYLCGMRRSDIRMAWREKVTLCGLIFLICAAMIWFIAFFGQLVCPHQDLFTQSELQAKSNRDNAYVTIRGEVFDLTSFAPRHWASEVIPTGVIFQYAGQDASDLFPIQVSALCDGVNGFVPKEVTLDAHINITDSNAAYHDFRSFRDDYRPDWYYEQMVYLRRNYRIGFMGYDPIDIKNQAVNPVQMGGISTQRLWAIIHNNVYDLTSYLMGGRSSRVADGQVLSTEIDLDFMDNSISELFRQLAGTDISAHFDALPLDKLVRERQLTCLRNLFFVGMVDTRNSFQCLLSEYLLLLITGFLCSVILFKFLAALRIGSQPKSVQHDKFIICQVPCYTEGEESLRKTINSLTVLKYDDKRKLLFLIADGMIVGSGNDRSTPRIVLDILGVDPNIDPEPKSFISLGEGQKQHNMGKVYSGLYEYSGHVVPFVVVVKVGTAQERQKPGNRGKRDSQMVLMRFLNKVHFDSPMTPLELEIHHQIKNVIGVNPEFYEFVLMVDADTEVLPTSLNKMVACFVNDSKIVGLCGETMLSNEKDTWVTMIQVYEYYISHHLAKAFESLFGSVTCLPGCFCMYRVRSSKRNQPLLVSNEVISDYAENNVNTLHKKNLLHLGEDRYLTTLILKHFPNYKTKFTPDAACMTNAPDQWPILLSQRRRWINSTVHNLGELMFLPQLCGFCCFSMRFVVMLDLLSTLVMPAVVCYLGYLIYQLCTNTNQVPLMSIVTLAGVYGLQAFIFILRRKWEHVGWMIVYILAIPVFSFYIPIYAFWHFDDFSWGNTRIVVGEKGQKKAMGADEGVFDSESITMKRWSEHEQALTEEWRNKDKYPCQESECSCEVDEYDNHSHVPRRTHHCCSQLSSSTDGCSHEGAFVEDATWSVYSGMTIDHSSYSYQNGRNSEHTFSG